MKKIVNICEEYADQFDIKFNGHKSKVILFCMKGLGIIAEIYVKGELVPCVNEIVYLGHVIKNDTSDTLIESVVRDFNSKFNSFMADFGCTRSVVKNKLVEQYCLVFYGFQNCALYDKDIERLYVTSRKVLRILWRLLYQTHSALLPHITGIPPLDVGIAERFFKTYSYSF